MYIISYYLSLRLPASGGSEVITERATTRPHEVDSPFRGSGKYSWGMATLKIDCFVVLIVKGHLAMTT
jgi:hypothetical protein